MNAVDKLLKTKWDSDDSDTTHWDVFVDRLLELDSEYECDNTLDGSKKTLVDFGYSEGGQGLLKLDNCKENEWQPMSISCRIIDIE